MFFCSCFELFIKVLVVLLILLSYIRRAAPDDAPFTPYPREQKPDVKETGREDQRRIEVPLTVSNRQLEDVAGRTIMAAPK